MSTPAVLSLNGTFGLAAMTDAQVKQAREPEREVEDSQNAASKKKKRKNKKKKHTEALRALVLSNSKLDDDNVEAALLDGLAHAHKDEDDTTSHPILEICLQTNRLTDKGLKTALDVLSKKSPQVRRLKLSGNRVSLENELTCKRVVDWLVEMNERSLDLSSNRITAAGLERLSTYFEHSPLPLKNKKISLNISGHNFAREGAATATKLLKSGIRQQGAFLLIEMRSCCLNDDDAKALAAGIFLAGEGVVTEVDLKSNKIENVGSEALKKVVQNRGGLKIRIDGRVLESERPIRSQDQEEEHLIMQQRMKVSLSLDAAACTSASKTHGVTYTMPNGKINDAIRRFYVSLGLETEEEIDMTIDEATGEILELISDWVSGARTMQNGDPLSLPFEESSLRPLLACIPVMAEKLSIERPTLVNSGKQQLERLGLDRACYLQVVSRLMQEKVLAAFELAIEKSQFAKLALDVFFRFPAANIAHTYCVTILKAILDEPLEYVTSSRWSKWQEDIIETTGFLDRIVSVYEEEEEAERNYDEQIATLGDYSRRPSKPCNFGCLSIAIEAICSVAKKEDSVMHRLSEQHTNFSRLVEGRIKRETTVRQTPWDCGSPTRNVPVMDMAGGNIDISQVLRYYFAKAKLSNK